MQVRIEAIGRSDIRGVLSKDPAGYQGSTIAKRVRANRAETRTVFREPWID